MADRTISGTRDRLHEAIDAGCDFASRTFREPQPDGLMTIAAAIVLAAGAHATGIVRALGAPAK